MNKSVPAVLVVCLLLCAGGLAHTQSAALAQVSTSSLKIGDYIQFGRYAGEPLLWRVIEDSANPDAKVGDVVTGDPLLFSNHVIAEKPFDAAGPHENDDDGARVINGSNHWESSNLRTWLNSSDGAGSVIWPDGNPPTADAVESNPYANEKGFLADGNFTEFERSLIKPVEQRALLYAVDRDLAVGGTQAYKYNDELADIVNNYENSWFEQVTDSVFLLDPVQINGVYNRFGTSYCTRGLDDYWLRAPDTRIYTDSSSANVLYLRHDGVVMYSRAKKGSIGIRPALVLDRELIVFESGDGSFEDPYIIGQ